MVKTKKCSKKIKLSEDETESTDRISNLPDPLISKILSLLSIENAVATSALSRRWRYLWTSITTLNLAGELPKKKVNMKTTRFLVFINRVFMFITPTCIHKFRFISRQPFYDPIHLEMWVSVIAQTVRELNLDICPVNRIPFELQMNHFCFNKLVILKLRGNINLNIPPQASVCFPNLQALYLDGIKFAIANDSSVSFPNLLILHFCDVIDSNKELFHKLVSSCPVVLQELYLSINLPGVIDFKIPEKSFVCFTNLQQLHLSDITFSIPDESSVSFPNLKILSFYYFDCPNGESVQKLISSCPSLRDLHIDISFRNHSPRFPIRIPSVTKLQLRRLSCDPAFKIQFDDPHKLQFLSISSSALKVIENGFPDFNNLKRLDFNVTDCSKMSLVINNLLECMDNLEHLAINMGSGSSCSCAKMPRSQDSYPLNVPKGLSRHVMTISFDQLLDGCRYQLEFLKYILKNASVLQVLNLNTPSWYSSETRNQLVKKVSKFAKKSQACQVKFTS